MSDFNYEIERTNHYFFENFRVDGKAVQDGTPTPDNPIDIQVVEPVNGTFGISVNGTVTPIDLQGNVLASLPDGTKDVLTVDSAGHVVLEKRVGLFSTEEITFTAVVGYTQNVGSARWYNTIDELDGVSIVLPNTGNTGYCNIGPYAANSSVLYGVPHFYVYGKRLYSIVGDISSSSDAVSWMNSNVIQIAYPLANPQTIDLGHIDVSSLQDIETEIPITLIASLETETEYSYSNRPSYKVENPYENADAPNIAYPPVHFGQEWETFDANDWNKAEMLDYTGQDESHAVYTVELCELMQSGTFDWSRPELDWSEAAYDAEQYERFCKYFESRFMFREISMLPPLQWFMALHRMLVYELMPKYKPLYSQVESGLAPLGENEYYKRRHITSNYPETLLSGNSDYITTGDDEEFERVKVNNAAEALEAYRNGYRSVDAALGDELEVLFISMYTSYVNGL